MNTAKPTKQAAPVKPASARIVKACARFVSAWVAIRPYAPEELRDTLTNYFAHLERERKTTNEKALQSFDLTLLAEFGRKGKKSTRQLTSAQAESLTNEFLSAFAAFVQTVPRSVHEHFADALTALWNEYFNGLDTDRMVMRRAFNLE